MRCGDAVVLVILQAADRIVTWKTWRRRVTQRDLLCESSESFRNDENDDDYDDDDDLESEMPRTLHLNMSSQRHMPWGIWGMVECEYNKTIQDTTRQKDTNISKNSMPSPQKLRRGHASKAKPQETHRRRQHKTRKRKEKNTTPLQRKNNGHRQSPSLTQLILPLPGDSSSASTSQTSSVSSLPGARR